MLANIGIVVQALIDEYANSMGYSSAVSAISYVNSSNQKYRDEAKAVIDYRDFLWAWAERMQEMGKQQVVVRGSPYSEIGIMLKELWCYSRGEPTKSSNEQLTRRINRLLV